MLESFCAASNIKVFLRRPGCPPILQECADLLAQCYGDQEWGSLQSDIRTLTGEHSPTSNLSNSAGKLSDLEEELADALFATSRTLKRELPGWEFSREAKHLKCLTVGGLQYANFSATKRNSIVFFLPSPNAIMVPGVIRQIFSICGKGKMEHHHFAIHRYLPLTVTDPFTQFEDFGASIWSKTLSQQVEIIPASRKITHAIQRPWDNSHYILKTLDRVYPVQNLKRAYLSNTTRILEFLSKQSSKKGKGIISHRGRRWGGW